MNNIDRNVLVKKNDDVFLIVVQEIVFVGC